MQMRIRCVRDALQNRTVTAPTCLAGGNLAWAGRGGGGVVGAPFSDPPPRPFWAPVTAARKRFLFQRQFPA